MIRTSFSILLGISLVTGCGSERPAPFDPQPDTGEGLTDVGGDVLEVLEGGTLPGSCDAYWAAVEAGTDNRRDRLKCGKEMFFYEGFETLGLPRGLFVEMLRQFPEQLGTGAEGVGMITDPTSDDGLPLGLAPGAPFGVDAPSLAFTCASCHFGQMPDGRYAVGAPNHEFDYAELILALTVVPQATFNGQTPDPSAAAILEPYFTAMEADETIANDLLTSLVPVIEAGATLVPFGPEVQAQYASWKTGTMDFIIAPLPVDDEVHTISKIPSIWGIAGADDVERYGMDGALLGATGAARSVLNFLQGFVLLGEGDESAFPDERLGPLEDYILSLRQPANPAPLDAELVARGESLFVEAGCATCHDGARGSSRRTFEFEEIGTDDAMRRWLDPDLDGVACCFDLPDEELSHGIRAPRLVGIWTSKRLLHNGSVDSLEDLFCINGERPTITESPWSDRGHDFPCQLADETKRALIEYLRSL